MAETAGGGRERGTGAEPAVREDAAGPRQGGKGANSEQAGRCKKSFSQGTPLRDK